MGDTAMELEMIETFIESTRDEWRKFETALAASTAKDAEIYAHSIKGAAKYTGAKKVLIACSRMGLKCLILHYRSQISRLKSRRCAKLAILTLLGGKRENSRARSTIPAPFSRNSWKRTNDFDLIVALILTPS